MKRIQQIEEVGQAIWLDDISREWLQPKGFLYQLISEHNAYGLTTNPSIFAKALQNDPLYAANLAKAASAKDADATALLWSVMKEDIAKAADIFRPLYERSNGMHGYVSIEVDPTKAHDTQGTITDGNALWRELAKPNVMIKVPATTEGLEAIETLTEAGVNINATLLFSVERYEAVLHAWARGLQKRVQSGRSIDQIHSVASFFISRLDALVDPQLKDSNPELVGKAAVANAKAAYAVLSSFQLSDEWKSLLRAGGNIQRLLWASTGVKDPSFPVTKYIDELIAPNTVNTVPLKTLQTVAETGSTTNAIPDGSEFDTTILDALAKVNIDLAAAAKELEIAGVAAFIKDYEAAVAQVQTALDAA